MGWSKVTFRPALLHNRSGHQLDATHCAGPKVTDTGAQGHRAATVGKSSAPASPDQCCPRVTRETMPMPREGPRLPRARRARTESTSSRPRRLRLPQRRTADGRLANGRDPQLWAPADLLPGEGPPQCTASLTVSPVAEGKGAPWGLLHEVTDRVAGAPPS